MTGSADNGTTSARELLGNVARGAAMGAADIVPGVSGGTIALILGIYERVLGSVRTGARALGRLARGDLSGFRRQLFAIEWTLIGPLLVDIGAAVIALSSIIDRLLEDEPEAMAGLFFGLVVASILIGWELLDQRDAFRIVALIGVGVATFVLLGLQSGTVASPPLAAYFVSGAIAICAMILPGVSGSFLLLMLGMYGAVIGAVHDRLLTELFVFLVGAVIGLALFSTLLSWILTHHRDTLLAALIGLMAGSLRVLWPWPNGVGVIGEENEVVDGTGIELPPELGDAVVPTVLGLVAFIAIMALHRLAPTTHD